MKITNAGPNSMSLAIIDRRNRTVVDSVPFPDALNPHIPPPLETTVWHYIRFEFFQAILKNKAMRFTRLDKQSDKTDGAYSEANALEMTAITKNLLSSVGIKEGPKREQLLQTNEILREKSYVHCWSIRPRESPWMWNEFLQGEIRSVAIKSTVGRLRAALHGQAVDFQKIIYYPPGVPRPDWSYSAPFAAKDKTKYREEREFRLISIDEIEADKAEYKLIPIDTKALFGKIVVHPLSSREFRNEAQIELKSYSLDVHVARSELRSSDLKAVAQSKGR